MSLFQWEACRYKNDFLQAFQCIITTCRHTTGTTSRKGQPGRARDSNFSSQCQMKADHVAREGWRLNQVLIFLIKLRICEAIVESAYQVILVNNFPTFLSMGFPAKNPWFTRSKGGSNLIKIRKRRLRERVAALWRVNQLKVAYKILPWQKRKLKG